MNLLVSYAHISKEEFRWLPLLELWASKGLPVMIDSGAFSTASSGVPIDHQKYMDFCRRISSIGPHVEHVQLDKLRDPVVSKINLDKEYQAGLKSVPVFIATSPYSEFVNLVNNYNTRVCVAGAAGFGPKPYCARVSKCMDLVGDVARIHGLGFTAGFWPIKSRAWSFDSTSWLAALKWGNVNFYDNIKGVTQISSGDMKAMKFEALKPEIRQTLIYSGIKEADLRGSLGTRTQRSMVSFLSAHAWLRYAERLAAYNKRFFFAAVKPWMLTQLILACKHQLPLGINWRGIEADMPPLMETLSKGTVNIAIVDRYLSEAVVGWRERSVGL